MKQPRFGPIGLTFHAACRRVVGRRVGLPKLKLPNSINRKPKKSTRV